MNLAAVLADLADQAGTYANPDRAIRAARRRRRTRFAVTSCAATVAVLLGVVAYLPSLVDRGGGGPATTLGPTATPGPADRVPPRLRALYPRTVAPQPGALFYPQADAAPGPASLLYAPCPRGDCWPNLVLPDGTQYRLPDRYSGGQRGQPWDLTLSPDGRYAGWRYREETGWYHVVDLQTGALMGTGGQGGQLPVSPWVWSPDSKRLLLAEHRDGQVVRYFQLDPESGSRELPAAVAGGDGSVVGIRNNGDLLVWVGDFGGQLPELRMVDPDSNQVKTLPPAAAGGLLAEGERVMGLLNSPCDCAVWFTVFAPGETGRPTALVGMDLADGHLTGRIDLPASAEHGGAQPGVWEARSSLPGGVALVRHHPDGTDIEILNDVSGERVAVTRIEADAHVVLRGQARW